MTKEGKWTNACWEDKSQNDLCVSLRARACVCVFGVGMLYACAVVDWCFYICLSLIL